MWRGGPAGPKSLCNACGIRYRKKRRVVEGVSSRRAERKKGKTATATTKQLLQTGQKLSSTEKAKDSIFYSYERHINGFAAVLEEEEAAQISKHPDVVSVFLNKGRRLHTTHSWDFMLLENKGIVHSSSAWKKARFGQDTIIANLDTGVWPESESFSDQGLGPVPSRWKRVCEIFVLKLNLILLAVVFIFLLTFSLQKSLCSSWM